MLFDCRGKYKEGDREGKSGDEMQRECQISMSLRMFFPCPYVYPYVYVFILLNVYWWPLLLWGIWQSKMAGDSPLYLLLQVFTSPSPHLICGPFERGRGTSS